MKCQILIGNEFKTYGVTRNVFWSGPNRRPNAGWRFVRSRRVYAPLCSARSALFCAALMSCLVLPKSQDDEDLKPTGPNMLTLLRIPGVFIAAISIICTSMSIGFLQATLEPHLRQFLFTPAVLGLMFVINGGTYAASAPAWGWLCDRPGVRPKYITAVGCLCIGGGFLLIGPAPFFNIPTTIWVTVVD
ncbi:hypothetical protein evm_013852 [Chilo suppressalis]|nr:hypothetical protein evm_013852 [Chilo suppressalis]